MPSPTEKKILAVFAIEMVVFGTAAVFSYKSSQQVAENHRSISQTQQSLQALSAISATLSDAEHVVADGVVEERHVLQESAR